MKIKQVKQMEQINEAYFFEMVVRSFDVPATELQVAARCDAILCNVDAYSVLVDRVKEYLECLVRLDVLQRTRDDRGDYVYSPV